MLVQAGLEGVRQRRQIELESPPALPTSLAEALTRLEQNGAAGEWLGPALLRAYLLFKRAELKSLQDLEEAEICRRYMNAY
jgi:glutamine synthetase